jgi:Skp family chaperone for outer membrane proteins
MKIIRLIAVFAFAAIFAVSAFAQAQPTAGSFKIGIINTSFFDDDKDGIKRFSTAMSALETQMKPELTALQAMSNRLQSLQTEIEGYQKQLQDPSPKVPIDKAKIQAAGEAKAAELEKMKLEFDYKQKDYQLSLQRRGQVVTGPIRADIANAIQEFAKAKGYAMVLDAAKLDGAGLILGFDEKYDVTKEFITFYNARPAGTATTASPK